MFKVLSASAVVLFALGCAGTDSEALVAGDEAVPAPIAESDTDAVFVPGTYQALTFAGGPAYKLFINRRGGTFGPGNDNARANTSWIIKNKGLGQVVIPPYEGTDAQWNQAMGCVRNVFKPFNVEVVETEPATGDFTEIVVGSDGTPLNDKGWGGRATSSCDIIPNAMGFVYSASTPNNLEWLCSSIAHEAGHTFSLDHEFLCQDPMTYLFGCGTKTFQASDQQCGENAARACSCNRPSQNTVKILNEKLGVAGVTTPAPPPPAPSCGKLAVGQSLSVGGKVVSCDGRFRFVLQTDGNVVLYQGAKALWASHTNGKAARRLTMQADGNLVLYDGANRPLWHSQTYGKNGAALSMQNDGNAVLYQNGKAVWSSGTCCH